MNYLRLVIIKLLVPSKVSILWLILFVGSVFSGLSHADDGVGIRYDNKVIQYLIDPTH